jgi:hypothetical protein
MKTYALIENANAKMRTTYDPLLKRNQVTRVKQAMIITNAATSGLRAAVATRNAVLYSEKNTTCTSKATSTAIITSCVVNVVLWSTRNCIELLLTSEVVPLMSWKITNDAMIKTAQIHTNREIPRFEVFCSIRKSLT